MQPKHGLAGSRRVAAETLPEVLQVLRLPARPPEQAYHQARHEQQEQQAIEEAVQSSTGNPVQVGDEVVSPASYGAGRTVAAGISALPTPLKAALGLLAVGALAALLTVIVPRVRDRFSS